MDIDTVSSVILFLLYTFTFSIITWYIFNHTKDGWSIESFFLAIFLLFYVIIPISSIINDNIFILPFKDQDIELYANEYTTYGFRSFSMMLIFLFFFFIGIHIASSKQYIFKHIKERHLDIHIFKISILKVIGIFFSILSFASIFIYTSHFGSIEQAIYYANWVRAGAIDEIVLSGSQYIFVSRFIPLSMLSLVIYIFIKEKSNIFYIIFLLLLPLSTTLFSRTFLFAGKEAMIQLFLYYFFTSL